MSTFVLIPGAGGTAWYWHRIIPLLQRAGHEAIAVDLPGDDPTAGLLEYTRLVADAIGDRDDVVLVAQSLGGFTAPLVAAKVPLRGLVFVNAMIPSPGETPGAWWDNTGWLAGHREHRVDEHHGAQRDLRGDQWRGERAERLRHQHHVVTVADRVGDQAGVLGQARGGVIAGQVDGDRLVSCALQQRDGAVPVPGGAASARDQYERAHERTSSAVGADDPRLGLIASKKQPL